jgi:NADH:ubiquinone oxidoreductase subunit 3 (subunit A)
MPCDTRSSKKEDANTSSSRIIMLLLFYLFRTNEIYEKGNYEMMLASLRIPLLLLMSSVLFITVDADEIVLDPWNVRSYLDRTASVGDTVVFSWTGTHNVYIHPSGTCDETGRVEVGSVSPSSYMFNDVGTVTFACDVFGGAHCNAGQIVKFEVFDRVAPAPSDAPFASPVLSIEDTLSPSVEFTKEAPAGALTESPAEDGGRTDESGGYHYSYSFHMLGGASIIAGGLILLVL